MSRYNVRVARADQDAIDTVILLELDAPARDELREGKPLAVPEPVSLELDFPLDRQVFQRGTRAGFDVPWLTAQATYHGEGDPADDEFRAAQAAVWKAGLALEGPDTDALRAEYRDGVHFNAKGLHRHGELWAEKVAAYIQAR